MQNIKTLFTDHGGQFITPIEEIQEKLKKIKAYIFDWDGVFNSGVKGESKSSNYSEIDAMGTNMLRLGYWLANNKELPMVSIITGESNKIAVYLAEREHFNHVYFNVKNKAAAFDHLLDAFNLKPEAVAFIFDDILDLTITKRCGLRFMAGRKGSPLFNAYAVKNDHADYITGQDGGHYAVREISELILGLQGQYDQALNERIAFGQNYADYLAQRNAAPVKKFVFENNQIKILT